VRDERASGARGRDPRAPFRRAAVTHARLQARVDRPEQPLRAQQHRRVDHPAVDGQRAAVDGPGGGEHPARPVELGVVGAQAEVHRRHLGRVDAQPRAEAQPAGASGVAAQRLLVVDGGGHAVHRGRQAGQPRHQHQLRAEVQQRVVVALDAEVDLEVERAEHQALHAAHAGQRAHGVEAGGRLHQRQQRPSGRSRGCLLQHLGAVRLGHDDAAHPRVGAQAQVVTGPRRGRGVDAQQHRRARRPVEPGCHRVARDGLGGRGHGILEVDDHRVGAAGQGLREALGPVSGNEEVGAGRHRVPRRRSTVRG
jgi:hypothetical protein